MKKVFITLMSLLVLLVTLNNLQAQDKKDQHKVHIKVKKIVDGKETVVDSVFTIDGDADLDEIMKKLGHDKEMGELHKHKDGDKDVEVKIEKRVERRVIKKGEGEEVEIQVEVEEGEHEEGDVYIFKSEEEGDKKVLINIDGEDADKKVFIMKSGDGKVIEIDAEGEEDLIIIKDGEKVDVKEMMKEEGGSKKVIRIKTNKEGKDGEEKMIWHSDDGKVMEIDGDKVKEKKMVFIKKSEDGEVDITDEEIKQMLKEKGIDWEGLDKEKMIIKKSRDINISINPLEAADIEVMKGMGLEEEAFNSGLEIGEMKLNVESEGPVMMQVSTEESGNLEAVVRDTAGEVISKTVLKESSNAYKIYLSLEDSGTYYVTLTQGGKSLTQKLVIKKA